MPKPSIYIMKTLLLKLIKGLLHPLLERLRSFFNAPTMLALDQLRQDVRDLHVPDQPINQSSVGVSVDLQITPIHNPVETTLAYLDAGTLHSLFSIWTNHSEILRQASLVVACPLTADAARTLLQPSEMVIIVTPQDWHLLLTGRRYDVIALVGLELMHQALQSKSVLYQLIRACRRELFYLAKSDDDVLQQRRALHQVGFYEVSSVLPNGRTDYNTVGRSAKGDFILRGNQPALTWPGGEWCLHTASRVGQPEGPATYPWKSVLANGLQASTLGWTGIPDALSLSVYKSNTLSTYAIGAEQRVQAVMQWSSLSGEGHASLVGGYHGPSDTDMVLAMIQVGRKGEVSLSLWLHDNEWQCLKSTQIQTQDCQIHAGHVSVQCWLHLTADYMRAGCGPHELIAVPVIHGLRTTVAGLRIYGQHIAVKDFEVQFGDGHV